MTPDLKPGATVRVVDGPLRDMRGKVLRRASWGWSASVPQYLVDVKGLERVLRADYLVPA